MLTWSLRCGMSRPGYAVNGLITLSSSLCCAERQVWLSGLLRLPELTIARCEHRSRVHPNCRLLSTWKPLRQHFGCETLHRLHACTQLCGFRGLRFRADRNANQGPCDYNSVGGRKPLGCRVQSSAGVGLGGTGFSELQAEGLLNRRVFTKPTGQVHTETPKPSTQTSLKPPSNPQNPASPVLRPRRPKP